MLLDLSDDSAEARAQAMKLRPQLKTLDPVEFHSLTDLAWGLSMCPDLALRDSKLALQFAQRANKRLPRNRVAWRALAAAQLSDGDAETAVASARRAVSSIGLDDARDWFVLAQACARTNRPDDARKAYSHAVAWTRKHRPDDLELRRLHRETERLLTPSTPPKSE